MIILNIIYISNKRSIWLKYIKYNHMMLYIFGRRVVLSIKQSKFSKWWYWKNLSFKNILRYNLFFYITQFQNQFSMIFPWGYFTKIMWKSFQTVGDRCIGFCYMILSTFLYILQISIITFQVWKIYILWNASFSFLTLPYLLSACLKKTGGKWFVMITESKSYL